MAARSSQDDVLDELRRPGQVLGVEREKAEEAKTRKKQHEKV